jgi:hypothetical protein
LTLLSGPETCGDHECYQLEVDCSQVSRSEEVSLKVGAPTNGAAEKGTILFFTGWIGNYWWAEEDALSVMRLAGVDSGLEQSSLWGALSNNAIIVAELRANGFRTVQVKWRRGWFIAEQGQDEDFGKLACKPASVIRWVRDNLHTNTTNAFCATGHSNGASALAYAMTQYQLGGLFSLAVLEGGPNWARLDYSCVLDADHADLFGKQGERNTIDWGFGYPNDGTGICAQQTQAEIERFQNASLAYDQGSFVFPNTLVAFVIGENDATTTAHHGEYFYNWLVDAGTPLLTYETVPGADHFTTGVQAGADVMQNKLLNECRVR